MGLELAEMALAAVAGVTSGCVFGLVARATRRPGPGLAKIAELKADVADRDRRIERLCELLAAWEATAAADERRLLEQGARELQVGKPTDGLAGQPLTGEAGDAVGEAGSDDPSADHDSCGAWDLIGGRFYLCTFGPGAHDRHETEFSVRLRPDGKLVSTPLLVAYQWSGSALDDLEGESARLRAALHADRERLL